MINTDDFIKRLEIILEYYGVNASAFADKIGVQRSSLSHLLSGRNKPSLDFILKIMEVYPEVDLYWILNGEGNFPKNNDKIKAITSKVEEDISAHSSPSSIKETANIPDLFSEEIDKNISETLKEERIVDTINRPVPSNIEKIVFFYKNGTFKIFTPD